MWIKNQINDEITHYMNLYSTDIRYNIIRIRHAKQIEMHFMTGNYEYNI